MLNGLTSIFAFVTAAISLASIVIVWWSYRSVQRKLDSIQARMDSMNNADVIEDESVSPEYSSPKSNLEKREREDE
jgi:cbb3-type cytochrome oxidase subunit 3